MVVPAGASSSVVADSRSRADRRAHQRSSPRVGVSQDLDAGIGAQTRLVATPRGPAAALGEHVNAHLEDEPIERPARRFDHRPKLTRKQRTRPQRRVVKPSGAKNRPADRCGVVLVGARNRVREAHERPHAIAGGPWNLEQRSPSDGRRPSRSVRAGVADGKRVRGPSGRAKSDGCVHALLLGNSRTDQILPGSPS